MAGLIQTSQKSTSIQPNQKNLPEKAMELSSKTGINYLEWIYVLLDFVDKSFLFTSSDKESALRTSQSYQDATCYVLWLLIENKEYDLVREICKNLLDLNSISRCESFSLNSQKAFSFLIYAVNKLESQGSIDASIKLRELAFEIDISSIENNLRLALHHALSRDESSALFFASIALESLENGVKSDRSIWLWAIQKLRNQSLEQHALFLKLIDGFARLSPIEEQPCLYAILNAYAEIFLPDHTSECQSYSVTIDSLMSDITHDYVRAFLAFIPVAKKLEKTAQTVKEANRDKAGFLFCQAAYYYTFGGILPSGKDALDRALELIDFDHLVRSKDLETYNTSIYTKAFLILFRVCYCLSYLSDDRQAIRHYQSIAADTFSRQIVAKYSATLNTLKSSPENRGVKDKPHFPAKPLKIGYLSSDFYKHSVGFLSHQAIGNHDPAFAQTYIYYASSKDTVRDEVTKYLEQRAYSFTQIGQLSIPEIIEKVRSDELDILVYMDALSNVKTCQLLSFRLAPIQISWLGGDSPGLPTIDYFFVDPYLLDETAQADYEEQLVRLPSFVGIDSFGVRDIDLLQFRRHLQIPDDAVIYLTAAAGWKRHPDCLRWQLEILRQVPNGYLIVKGVSDLQTVGEAFQQTACEFGVSDRIRLLALTFTVEEHRAQVGVADVILDTFPYTGATHSLEALWRGVPIVTRVGQHYYSRMTYALLKSIGIEVGIAGSEDEYINWGVRLGREPELLQAVKQQIRESYQTAPIWNSRRFARSLELFYQRIWQTHQTSLAGKLMQPAVELDTISDITEIGWQSWSADSNLTLADREFILSEFQQSHPASSAYQWNQLGLRQLLLAYQVGSSWQKQKYFEAALECFQVGLLYDSEHVPCWFNSLQVSMLLGDRHNSLRQAVKLLRFLQFISPARLEQMRGLVWGAPPVTSQDSNPSLRQKTYLKYLSLWLGQHASVVYRAEAQRFWRLLLDIDPSNKQACLIVAIALLREQRIEGIFHLQQLLASNPDYLPASIALDIGKQMVGEQQSNLVSLPYEGFSLTVEPTLFSIVTTVLLTQGQWFEAEIEFCRQFLAPGMSVIDVGANVGVYTFLAARCVGETGKVFAVEPTPTCVTCLESTISRNALGMQVKTIAAAAGESDGQVSFAMEAASVFNRVVTDAETTESFTVRQITLDNLWEMEGRPPIDLLKVDAEGAELATFRGAEQLLRTAVPVVLFENLHGLEAKGAASAEYLSELGYQFYIYRPAIGDLQPTNWQADAATSLNIIAITPQRRSQLEQAGRVSFANDDR